MDMADSERERVARLRTRRQTLAVEDSLEIFLKSGASAGKRCDLALRRMLS